MADAAGSASSGCAGRVVGRRREVELVVAALAADRHVLLEGPPGTGKWTLLRAVADELGIGFEFVEGNAELTPARLVGHFDPARVLADGYDPDVFVDGPLVVGAARRLAAVHRGDQPHPRGDAQRAHHGDERARAARAAPRPGGGRAGVPAGGGDEPVRRRRHGADLERGLRPRRAGWRSTTRPPADEEAIVGRRSARRADAAWIAKVVEVVRRTRAHPDVRIGSSVRGRDRHRRGRRRRWPTLRGLSADELERRPRRRAGRAVGAGPPARGRDAHRRGDRHRAVGRGVRRAGARAAREKLAPRLGPSSTRSIEGGRGGRRGGGRGVEADDARAGSWPGTRASSRSRPRSASSTRRRSSDVLDDDPDEALALLADLTGGDRSDGCASWPGGWPGGSCVDVARRGRRRPTRHRQDRDPAVPARRRRPRPRRQLRRDRRGARRRRAADVERLRVRGVAQARDRAVPARRPQRVDGRPAAGHRRGRGGGGGAWRAPADYSVLAFGHDVVVAKAQDVAKAADDVVTDVLALRGFGTTDLAGACASRRASWAARRRAGGSPCCCRTAGRPCRATSVAAARELDELCIVAPARRRPRKPAGWPTPPAPGWRRSPARATSRRVGERARRLDADPPTDPTGRPPRPDAGTRSPIGRTGRRAGRSPRRCRRSAPCRRCRASSHPPWPTWSRSDVELVERRR